MAEKIATHGHEHAHDPHAHHVDTFWSKYVFSTDHKMIAMQYMFTGMFMALIGGFFAYTFNMQMAFPGQPVPLWGGIVTPAQYNTLITNHGAIMIFWVAMPVLIAAFGNFLIPLMIGCDDMVFPRLNRLSYQIFFISVLVLLASFGPLIAGALMLFMDQQVGTAFFDPDRGGDPVLWQHLFWFFGHPEVYVVLLPTLGIVAEIITTFARKKLFAYRTVLYTVFGTGVLSFTVWAHHQFIAGIDPRMANVFTITTLLISVPIAEMMFIYIATLYGGSITLTTPMLWALAFLGEFLIGGVTGIFLGASGADIYMHDTYFVLAHFHYTFVPIAIIGTYAGLTMWFPKMFGKMMNETLGKLHFWLTIVAFNCIFIPLFVTGAAGDHRRIYNYMNFPDSA